MDVFQADRASVECVSEGCVRPIRYVKLQMCRPHYLALSRRVKAAKGLCWDCGKKRLKGQVYCSRCNGLKKRYYYGAVDEGVCTRCKIRKSTRGKTSCKQCRSLNNASSRATKNLYRAEGICVNCGQRKAEKGVKPLKKGNYASCGQCKRASRRRYAEARR